MAFKKALGFSSSKRFAFVKHRHVFVWSLFVVLKIGISFMVFYTLFYGLYRADSILCKAKPVGQAVSCHREATGFINGHVGLAIFL